jgi:predicted RND superfamily exporter protein
MKGHMKHVAICGVFAAVAIVLAATGTSAAILIPVAACVLMMGGMMVAMGMFANRHGGH